MNGILIVDKPQRWTSMDVCARLRGLLREKRVGHSGTLDPMATGVLPVFLGRATRAVSFAESDEKEYEASLRLGLVTDTQDIWGHVTAEREVSVSRETLEAALEQFRGDILQLPPMYSALKVDGKKLYDLARRGVEVERKPRSVTIHELTLLDGDGADYRLRVRCSKGTYVRTLCHDIGAALSCGGCMTALRRTRAGRFTLSDAHTMDELLAAAEAGTLPSLLRPVDSLFSDLPAVTLTENQEARCRCGNSFTLRGAAEGRCRVYGGDGTFLMLGEVREGVMWTVKSFF